MRRWAVIYHASSDTSLLAVYAKRYSAVTAPVPCNKTDLWRLIKIHEQQDKIKLKISKETQPWETQDRINTKAVIRRIRRRPLPKPKPPAWLQSFPALNTKKEIGSYLVLSNVTRVHLILRLHIRYTLQ